MQISYRFYFVILLICNPKNIFFFKNQALNEVYGSFFKLIFSEKPTIVQGPKDTRGPEGSDVQLQCSVTGNPEPVIMWRKRDGQIPAER